MMNSSLSRESLVCAPDSSAKASQIWSLWKRDFTLPARPESAILQVFADTRYRLWVNGEWVGSGPSRFHPSAPLFDRLEIAPFLKTGANQIRVETQFRGVSSFQSRPGTPSFGARGTVGDVDLATPGAWRVRLSNAREQQAPPFSFAQGPVEICDLERWKREWEDDAAFETPVAADYACFGELAPRCVPLPSGKIEGGAKLIFQSALRDDENRIIFARDFGALPGDIPGLPGEPRRFFVALFFESAREIEVELGLFWGQHFLGGQPLKQQKNLKNLGRQSACGHFKAGENLLFASLEVPQNNWGFAFSWPKSSGLRLRENGIWCSEAAPPTDFCPTDFCHTDFWAPHNFEDWQKNWRAQMTPLEGWPHSPHPAREVAFDRLEESGLGDSRVQIFDFEREILGFLRLEIECDSDTIVDVALDEALGDDGRIRLYQTNPFIHGVDRFQIAPGRHQIELFHPRGGRFLQLTTRSQSAAKIHSVEVRDATLPILNEGDFECSDSLLNWIFEVGKATTQACLPDVWVDCPWREQGAYLGDSLVEFHAMRTLSSDLSIMRRALELWAQCQNKDGQMPACAPAWYKRHHADFSLVFILALRDYLNASNDVDFAARLWPAVQKIWSSPLWKTGENGLWDADESLHLFLDWGVRPDERLGKSNGALNAFRAGALEASAQIARELGEDSAPFEEEFSRVKTAFQKALWREENGDFAPFALETDSRAHHTNALALRFGLCEAHQEIQVRENLLAALDLMRAPGNLKPQGGHLELYFWHYVLEAFSARGWGRESLEIVRVLGGPMREKGAKTFWETLHHGWRDDMSLCHAWSCAPLAFLSREILGVQPVACEPDHFVFSPFPGDVKWARGVFPHARGPIRVEWKIEEGELKSQIKAPEGVRISREAR